MGSQTGSYNFTTVEGMELLKEKMAEEIKAEIKLVIEKTRDMDTDIFGFGDSVYRKYPKEWKTLEAQWNEIFKTLDVEIDVKAELRGGRQNKRTGLSREGSKYGMNSGKEQISATQLMFSIGCLVQGSSLLTRFISGTLKQEGMDGCSSWISYQPSGHSNLCGACKKNIPGKL